MIRILLLNLLLVFAFVFESQAQERSVSGKVTEQGQGLPAVNVVVKGTVTGTTTDLDGNYKITVPSAESILVFSSIGFLNQEIAVGAQSVIDVGLASDVTTLSEVVVTAVGIEQNKANLGYSVQNLDGDKIVSAREPSLLNALSSKVAGVSVVSSSGSPGASTNIRIRGNTSIGRSNSPLFVIDGVPIDNSSGGQGNGTGGVDNSSRAIDINPNDVESLTVLKGAAATALYGIRAANGAIIITTKKGVKGAPKITYSTSYTIDEVNKLFDFQTEYAQGRSVGGVPTWRGADTGEGFSWGPAISDLEYDGSEYDYDRNGRLVPTGSGNGTPARGFDNVNNFFVKGYTHDNNLSVSGGSDKTTYYMSIGRLKSSGIVPNSDWTRTSFKTTVQTELTDKLTTGISATYSNTGGSRMQRGSNISGLALGLYRTSPSFDNGNGLTGQDAADSRDAYELPDGTQRSYRAGIYDSPYWTINKNLFEDNVNRVIGNVSMSYDILPWMKLSYKLGIDHYTDRTKGGLDVNSASNKTGAIFNVNINSTDLNSDLLLIFNKEISSDLRLDAILGHNYYTYDRFIDVTQGSDFGAPGFFNISNASTVQSTETLNRKQIHGVFGDIKLDYKSFLFLNLTARNDWSSTLPDNANAFFYPGVSMGFDLTEAAGIGNGPILSYAKLRASWGQVGNDAPLYATQSVFVSANAGGDGFISGIGFPAFGVNAFERSAQVGNNLIKPETTTTLEFGGELKFFKGKLGIDYTYYTSETKDQIISVNISNTTGFGSSIQNAGLIENTGHEITLYGNPVNTSSGFNWDIDVNFTKYETIVKELAEGIETIFLGGFTSASSRVVVGEPYGAIYGDNFQRQDGKLVIDASNGWPLVSGEDKVLGDPTPDWTAGIRNTITYKGISLSALLDIRKGGDIWNGTNGIINYFGTSQLSADERDIRGYVFDGVIENGDGSFRDNDIPVDYANPANGIGSYKWVRYGFGGLVEENVQDGSWVRLRELNLSYTLPTSIVENISFISGVQVGISGRNLWLETNYTGIDPETNLTGSGNAIGLDYFNMPNTKSYGINARITF